MKKSATWKGIGVMYSICIKFKEQLNWRPMCRQFESENACHDFVNEAFDRWPVKHISVFKNGTFLTCFRVSPRLLDSMRALAERMRTPHATHRYY